MEDLIEAVRGHQELYDPHHPNYLKLYIKDSIWQDIADELNYPDGKYILCKTKIGFYKTRALWSCRSCLAHTFASFVGRV